MAHTAAALSDTTSVTSPTPFSPFSSAYSVSSEATVVSEGQADLGAFQSVFFALSQLQLHHQHHPRSPHPNNAVATNTTQTGAPSTSTGPTPLRRHDNSTDDDDHDDDDDDHDTDNGFTTPSLYPVSPLNLDGTVSRSSIHPSTNPPSRAQLTHASEGSTDEAVASDIILTAGGASSGEGDEESVALASPHSQPSSSSASDSASDVYPAPTAPTFEDDDGGRWVFAESPYDPAFRPSASSEDSDLSPRQQQSDEVSAQVDEGTSASPSLGDMEAAFAFFAAERAKLVKQLEANKSGTPSTLAPSLPISGNNRKNNSNGNGNNSKRGGGGGKAHRKNKSSESGPRSHNSDEAFLDASPTPGASPSAPVTLSSSSPDDQIPDARRNQRRNGGGSIFPRAPKQNLNKSMRNGSSSNLSLATAVLSQSVKSQSQFPSSKQPRNRPSHHRHTRSLPIDSHTISSIHQQLQLPTATTLAPSPLAQSVISASGSTSNSDEAEKIRQLARKLTFQFPFDTPTLRRVMQNPQGAMGLRSHATPGSDEVLVAEGFFDPVYAAAGGSSNNNTSSALLYVFIDHSNILVGFLEWMKKQGIINNKQQLTIGGGKPKLSLSALALLLERGRRCLRKVLVASSPLYQSLDEMAGMGYQISVLQRVEIKEGSSRRNGMGHSRSSSFNSLPTTNPSTPNRKNGKGKGNRNSSPSKNNNNNNSNNNNAGSSTESESNNNIQQQRRKNSGNSNNSGSPGNGQMQPSFAARLVNSRRGGHHRRNSSTDVVSFMTPSNSSTSLSQIQEASGGTPSSGHSTPGNNSVRPRFREEAVDELLQLKLLQTLLDIASPPPPGSTIVLASGDAAKSQFNPEGFLGCVRKAVERGWNVEVVGWDEGRSRAYAELQNEIVMNARRGVHQGGMLDILSLDKWGMDLLENPPVVVQVN